MQKRKGEEKRAAERAEQKAKQHKQKIHPRSRTADKNLLAIRQRPLVRHKKASKSEADFPLCAPEKQKCEGVPKLVNYDAQYNH